MSLTLNESEEWSMWILEVNPSMIITEDLNQMHMENFSFFQEFKTIQIMMKRRPYRKDFLFVYKDKKWGNYLFAQILIFSNFID